MSVGWCYMRAFDAIRREYVHRLDAYRAGATVTLRRHCGIVEIAWLTDADARKLAGETACQAAVDMIAVGSEHVVVAMEGK